MTTVTIESVDNGFILKHGTRTIVATNLKNKSWAHGGKDVGEILEDIFNPPEVAEPVAPALKPLEAE